MFRYLSNNTYEIGEKMKIIGNILWIITGGLIISLVTFLIGIILCITIIGIPFGLQCFKLASLTLSPFGKEVDIDFDEHPFANILWLIVVGWELCFFMIVVGILFCITIVGIPFGMQMFKVAKLVLLPFGADII